MFLYICVRFCVIFLMISPHFQQLRAPLYENKSSSASSTAAAAQGGSGQLCNNSAGCGRPALKKDKEAINSFFKNEKIYNVTKILDDLLVNYDPIQRPNFVERGKAPTPTVVFVDIYVRSMSRITELDMEYKFECYFRQRWVDPRLSYKLGPSVLTVNIKMLERLWKPDTFFVNSYSANVHKVPSINKFFRIFKDGTVRYSMRLTVTAKCPMSLENFPIDSQNCPIYISSFAFPSSEIIYKWNQDKTRAIVVAKDMQMAQFDLLASETQTLNLTLNDAVHSNLLGRFKLSRQISYFVLQIYIPCILIVFLSWVGFYIDRDAIEDRISLGVTTVLTMALLIMESKIDLPKISYLTALDIYLMVCFGYVLSSVIEFVWVHHFTYYEFEELIESNLHNKWRLQKITNKRLNEYFEDKLTRHISRQFEKITMDNSNKVVNLKDVQMLDHFNNRLANMDKRPSLERKSSSTRDHHRVKSPASRLARVALNILRKLPLVSSNNFVVKFLDSVAQGIKYEKFSSISKIDRLARVLYPCSFALFNLIYWWFYLNQRKWQIKRYF